MALLFHDEPVVTYDLGIFCVLPQTGPLVNLGPIYSALQARGFRAEAETIVIGGVPVQFIAAYNDLVAEALDRAVPRTFEGVPVRVLSLEHPMAMMLAALPVEEKYRRFLQLQRMACEIRRASGRPTPAPWPDEGWSERT